MASDIINTETIRLDPKRLHSHHPLDVVRRATEPPYSIDSVIVGVSCGRDSVACLDLCRQHFRRVHAYFMYVVKGISFQEQYLSYLERRYSIEILRVPHWSLAHVFRSAAVRHGTRQSTSVRPVDTGHVDDYLRYRFGTDWIATGEKQTDSIERNAQIVACRGINADRHRIYPLAWWSPQDVQSYLSRQQIMMPPDYRIGGERRSGGSLGGLLTPREAAAIKRHFPEDFERIRAVFPFVESQVMRHEAGEAGEKSKTGGCDA